MVDSLSHKLPALQFYPGDWKKEPTVQALDYFHRGVWFEMLLMMHESERRGVLLLNGRKMPDEALATALGLPLDLVKQTVTKLLDYGTASVESDTQAIYSRRMVKDEKIRKIRAECGKLGGNPDLVKQTANQNPTTGVKVEPTPSSSSSSSPSSPPIVPMDGFVQFWGIYPKKKGKQVAAAAWVKHKCSERLTQILDAVAKQSLTDMWKKEGHRFVPDASKWINQSRWEDEVSEREFFPVISLRDLKDQKDALQLEIDKHPANDKSAHWNEKRTREQHMDLMEKLAKMDELNGKIANGGVA